MDNSTQKTKVKPVGEPTYAHCICGFFKSQEFDNGGCSVVFVIDRQIRQAAALKNLGEKLTPAQDRFLNYGQLNFSRENIEDLLPLLVDFLDKTKPKDEKKKA